MGFANASVSFTRFRILDSVPEEIFANITENLKRGSFQDIDNIPQSSSHGWVCLDDMLDSEWQVAPPQKGNFIVFSLRVDTRRVPAGVIKKHLLLAIRAEKEKMAENGKKFISRERIKEIKEQLMLKLNQRFLPVPAEFNVVWNIRTNEVWFASIQARMIELFMEAFLSTFNLHLEQLVPYNLAVKILEAGGNGSPDILDSLEATAFGSIQDEKEDAGYA